jgi:hypothetical protein
LRERSVFISGKVIGGSPVGGAVQGKAQLIAGGRFSDARLTAPPASLRSPRVSYPGVELFNGRVILHGRLMLHERLIPQGQTRPHGQSTVNQR